MSRPALLFIGLFSFMTYAALGSASISNAESLKEPVFADSPFDLVNAVNALRLSRGLAPYSINSILMYTAQSQADFLAATGSMTHTGPGGSSVTQRLLAAGYPLAGDLTLGGFRSENITGGSESMSAQAAVNAWTGDALHLDTMISPNLTEIGAGVAVSGGRVYYVIDCAQPNTNSTLQAATAVSGGTAVPAASPVAVIVPIMLSTPNAEGDIFHEVQSGQSLWQIAIAYEVKIDEIKSLNNLPDNNIYPGNKLLVKRGATLPTVFSPTEIPIQVAASTPTPVASVTAIPPNATSTSMLIRSSNPEDNNTIMKAAIAIIALALLGAGIFTWLGSVKKN